MSEAKILVVEDEGLTAMEIQRKLKNWGYEVPSFAFSREEAVKKAKDIKPDLILMDMMLKGKGDGVDAVREIKSENDVPIIYITAYDDIEIRERAESTNPEAYLIKPFEEQELQTKIKNALSGQKTGKKLLEIGKHLDSNSKDLGIIIINSKGLIRYFNNFAYILTGFTPEEIINKCIYEIFPIEEIKHDKKVKTYLEKFIVNENSEITQKTTIKQKNGSIVPVEYNLNYIGNENEFLGTTLIFKDLTQKIKEEESQKNRETLHFEILDTIDQAIIAFNADLKSIYCNNKIKELLDLNEDTIGKSISESIKSIWDEDIAIMCNKTLETNSPSSIIKSFENDLIPLTAEIKVYKLLDGLVVLLNDITEIKRRKDHLERNEKLYCSVVDDQSEIICRFNKDLELTFANKTYYNCFGFKNEANFDCSFSENDLEKMKAQLESFDKEKLKIFELPMKMLNGDTKWWQWVSKVNFDRNREISEYQLVGRDFTQHHINLENHEKMIEKLRSSIKEKNNEFDNIERSYKSKLSGKREEINFLKKIINDNDSKFKSESDGLRATISNQRSEIKLFQERETSFKENITKLENEIKNISNELQKLTNSLENETNLRQENETQLQNKKLELNQQKTKTKNSQNQIITLKRRITGLENSEISLKESKKHLEKEIINNQKELDEITSNLDLEISKRLSTEKALEEVKCQMINKIKEKDKEIQGIKHDFKAKLSNLESSDRLTRASLEKNQKTLENMHSSVVANMKMISSLNRLHSDYVIDQMVEKLQDGRSYLRSFGMIHEKLYHSPDLQTINAQDYLESVLSDVSHSHGAKNVDMSIKTNGIYLDIEKTVLSGLIVTELVINSFKHAFTNNKKGKIGVELSFVNENLVIKVSDNGIGLQHIELEKTDTFGLQLVKTIVEQSEGSLDFNGEDGANFIIKIPSADNLIK
ncbi:response regulator [Methanobacterium petrolearium]|uniref:response regulator n=1 Tax=Methanobacterium petrolearium TaxID=710190 RepID=UPI001AE3D80A|nr:response regulator [Methanobacterium petrolearium]MBP1944678.1 PAS domain S-box-containing protein [Methanobacterium petrolearium]BDZ69944.1 hypothetical protein GCM10025861_04610 [Methanobacterium petrolearium]